MHTHIPKPHAGKPGDIRDITEQLLVKSLAVSVKIDSQRRVYIEEAPAKLVLLISRTFMENVYEDLPGRQIQELFCTGGF